MGGSDSQYDLLIEAPNPAESSRSSYGHLLTVPNNLDGLSANKYILSQPGCCSSNPYRRLSDIPSNLNNSNNNSNSLFFNNQLSSTLSPLLNPSINSNVIVSKETVQQFDKLTNSQSVSLHYQQEFFKNNNLYSNDDNRNLDEINLERHENCNCLTNIDGNKIDESIAFDDADLVGAGFKQTFGGTLSETSSISSGNFDFRVI